MLSCDSPRKVSFHCPLLLSSLSSSSAKSFPSSSKSSIQSIPVQPSSVVASTRALSTESSSSVVSSSLSRSSSNKHKKSGNRHKETKRKIKKALSPKRSSVKLDVRMDILPSVGILYELQAIHDTGYLLSQASPEDCWHQVI